MQHWPFQPTIVVDITAAIEKKEAAIRAFSSQFLDDGPDDSEPETFVSSRRFFEAVRGRSREYGQQIGVTFGESFLYYGGPIPAGNLDFLLSTQPIR